MAFAQLSVMHKVMQAGPHLDYAHEPVPIRVVLVEGLAAGTQSDKITGCTCRTGLTAGRRLELLMQALQRSRAHSALQSLSPYLYCLEGSDEAGHEVAVQRDVGLDDLVLLGHERGIKHSKIP